MTMQDPSASVQTPTCHRCGQPMAFDSQQTVHGKAVNLFRCEHCDILEARDGDGVAA